MPQTQLQCSEQLKSGHFVVGKGVMEEIDLTFELCSNKRSVLSQRSLPCLYAFFAYFVFSLHSFPPEDLGKDHHLSIPIHQSALLSHTE